MAKSPYTDSVPIPDPVSKPAPKAPAPKPAPIPKPIKYPDSTPVDDPVSKNAKGGKISASARADGCAELGKTRGTIVMCGGGMYK